MSAEPPLVFDSTGKFLRYLGRAGQGPGEYQHAFVIFTNSDSVMVMDEYRYTVLAPTLSVIRTTRVDHVFNAGIRNVALLRNGDIVAAAPDFTAAGIGLPFHRLSAAGAVKSFGDVAAPDRSGRPQVALNIVGPSSGGSFWAAQLGDYVASLRNEQGQLVVSLQLAGSWVPTQPAPVHVRPALDPPRPNLNHLREDAAGRLWVAVNVAGERWREAMRPLPGGGTSEPRWDYLYNTVIDVIDWKEGRLVTEVSFRGYFLQFIDDGLFASTSEDANGAPFVEIWRMLIQSPNHP
jgi:hypothetical protein